jgi:hypothetical protein
LVKAMKDKPIQFLAVAANVTQAEALAYQQQTGLAMPVYADNLGRMQQRYGQHISLNNITQFRVVGPDGKVVGYEMSQEALEKILGQVKAEWRYKDQGYNAKLGPALDALEWGQYGQARKLLTPLRKATNKPVAESATKLFEALRKEGEQWKADADQAAEAEPVKAYDLYNKIATTFPGDELAKSVAEPLRKLAGNKAVAAELAARKALTQYLGGEGKLAPAQKGLARKVYQDLAKKHSGTPTGEKAAALAEELK